MKCVRDTGWSNFTWTKWNKECKNYAKQYSKLHSPYIRRRRTCENVIHQVDVITKKKGTRKIYFSMQHRIIHNEYLNRPKIKWQ